MRRKPLEYSSRPISYRQFGTIWHFSDHPVKSTDLGIVHQGTLASCLMRGWLMKVVRANGDVVFSLSDKGRSVLDSYQGATLSQRSKDGPLTDYAAGLLKLARLVKGKVAA